MATLGTFAAFASRGFSGSGQFNLANIKFPTGGDYIIEDNGFGKRVHIFINSGTFTVPFDGLASEISAQVLVVGAGGDAGGLSYWTTNSTINDENSGGGGAGGSIIYVNDYTIAKGMTCNVVVGASAGSTSSFEGLPPALGGGNGGKGDNFSRGEPGGRGGGGSWQNARPSGPRASTGSNRHPGYKYGTGGPAAPANYYQISTPALGPDYNSAPSCTIPISWADSVHGIGNGQYKSTTIPADVNASDGLANDSPYGMSFRSRGGGGTSATGGWGGQGVKSNIFKLDQPNQLPYEWFGAGGRGKPGYNFTDISSYPNGFCWRDAGIDDNGTARPAQFVASTAPSVEKFNSSFQNQYVENTRMPGEIGVGSGGAFNSTDPYHSDGREGRIQIWYDLDAYPGGAAAASANIFGGKITTSSNGRFRIHTWPEIDGLIERPGTSANSQTYYITGYRPYYYGNPNTFGTATEWPLRTNPYGSVANTKPFYYYGDIPFVTNFFKYIVVGGGGARGWSATGDAGEGTQHEEYHYGGGGAGGVYAGSFSRIGGGPYVSVIESLQDTLQNTKSDGTTERLYSDYFDFRPGYIEVYPNSFLNPKIDTYNIDYQNMTINRNPLADSRERNGRIRLRGNVGSGSTQQIPILRAVRDVGIDYGVWGSNTQGSSGPDSSRAWFYFYANPGANGNGNIGSIFENDVIRCINYDGYFYDNYFKVIVHGTDRFQTTIPDGTTTAKYVRGFSRGNWTGSALSGAGTISAAQRASNFQSATRTGTHLGTGEAYYNMIIIESAIPRWNGGIDRHDNFVNNVINRYGNGNLNGTGWSTNYDGTPANQGGPNPPMVKGLGSIDNNYSRWVSFQGSSLGATNGDRITIQWVIENSTGSASRQFRYEDATPTATIDVPAGWRVVSSSSYHNTDVKMQNGITQAITSGTGSIYDTYIKLYTWDLRRLRVRKIFVHDVQLGNGGAAGRVSPWKYRSGGPSSLHRMDSDIPNIFVGGGGSGGHRSYTSDAAISAVGGQSVTEYIAGHSNVFREERANLGYPEHGSSDFMDSPWGSAGGGSWRQNSEGPQANTVPAGSSGSYFNAGSQGVDSYGGGGSGGGGLSQRKLGDITIGYGAPRHGNIVQGRKNNSTLRPATGSTTDSPTNSGHGGRGGFGGTHPLFGANIRNWTYDVKSISCGGTTYYYSLYMDVYPHNAQFGAGGGGGNNNGSDVDLSSGRGGNGSSGFTSSITGISIVYGYGGGGFGRIRNGTPGNSLPANPSDQTPPAEAPAGPAAAPYYVPFGSGGGWSAGKQEGGGADGGPTKYYPGSGPWPVSYSVNVGEDHMDAMRFWYTPAPAMPAPQKGDIGRPFGGKQGVVIVSYDKGPFIYT